MILLPWFSLLLRGRERSAFFRYGIAISSICLSLFAGLWLRPFTYRSPNLFFYAAILISLLYGGLGAGLASTILSALAVNYFFFPPYGHFSLDAASIFNGVYFCLSFGIICWLIDAKWERVEGERRESEERVRLFIEHAPAAWAMFDREMRYVDVSLRWRTDYGLGDRDLRGVSHYELFPEISEHWKQAHSRALAGEVLREENERFDRADGSVQWIQWETRPWRDSKGVIGGIVIFADDVSVRKQAADVRERLAAIVDSSDDAIIAKTLDGTISAWNSSAEKVFGYSSAEAVGKPILMLLPPERAGEESDILARIRGAER
jgi:PAS domain S-box-containing protein